MKGILIMLLHAKNPDDDEYGTTNGIATIWIFDQLL